MKNIDYEYKRLLSRVLDSGVRKKSRTKTWTLSHFGATIEHDMRNGFPLITTKYVSFKCAKTELLWILNGRTDLKYLEENGVHYWNNDYKRSGRTDNTLGKIYGVQWRNFNGVDQIYNLLKEIEREPSSRRLVVSAWNPVDMDDMVLPPCHDSFQVYIYGNEMDLLWRQRSVDLFLGLPYDIAMYGLLLEILCETTGKKPRKLIGHFGDCHLYDNHIENAIMQLARLPKILPSLSAKQGIKFNGSALIMPDINDFKIEGYKPHGKIKAEFPE